MQWYAETASPTLPADRHSLLTAYANLLAHHDVGPISPDDLHRLIGPNPVELGAPVFDPFVTLGEVHENYPVWPTQTAIVKFIRTNPDGSRTGHYCLVIDAASHTIIDSFDGEEKIGDQYGQIYAWATFHKKPFVPVILEEDDPVKWQAGSYHVWKKGDSLHDVALSMGVTRDRLMQYNEILEQQELEDGVPIHYPATAEKTARTIRIEINEPVLYMHVAKPGGIKKWMFGSMARLDDAIPSGFYPERSNVIIAATAYVPIVDQDGHDAEAAYYLDYNALGDYKKSGILRYTYGYAWSDLEHGHVETLVKRPEPAPEAIETKTDEETDTDSKSPTKRVELYSKAYKDEIIGGYQKLPELKGCVAVLPIAETEYDPQTGKRYVWIHDFSGKRHDLPLYQNQVIDIAATFPSGGRLYGQPTDSMDEKIFYGIPMDWLESEEHLYHTEPVDPQTRADAGLYITGFEKYVLIPINKFLWRTLPGYMKNIHKEKK